MQLIPSAISGAAEISAINTEIAGFLRSQLQRAYNTLFRTGNPQDVLDALGENAGEAFRRYAALYGALAAIGEAGDLPVPLATVFVPNSDGSLKFVPPPAPEPEPEPSPE